MALPLKIASGGGGVIGSHFTLLSDRLSNEWSAKIFTESICTLHFTIRNSDGEVDMKIECGTVWNHCRSRHAILHFWPSLW